MKKYTVLFLVLLLQTMLISCKKTSEQGYESPIAGTLRYVPAGLFHRDENSANTTGVSAFRIAEHEITREQFLNVMGADPSDTAFSGGITDPVQNVNWYMAIAFCNKLSIKEKLLPVYSVAGVDFSLLKFEDIPVTENETWNSVSADAAANGYRLPTEAEWQWAAMGAEDKKDKPFAGSTSGSNIDDYAWYYNNSGDKYISDEWNWNEVERNRNRTHSAGEKKPNELGLYDMSGNVWELCWDLYGAYPSGPVADYRGASSGKQRTFRGGGWYDSASYCGLEFRYIINPEFQQYNTGFRVARN
ncbi:MAG: formylglycine-generating enzyme family protein [Spirochaetes bacterium]|nr:formylglycine-generating enzyme family protein [Spirochaetota bacterium]